MTVYSHFAALGRKQIVQKVGGSNLDGNVTEVITTDTPLQCTRRCVHNEECDHATITQGSNGKLVCTLVKKSDSQIQMYPGTTFTYNQLAGNIKHIYTYTKTNFEYIKAKHTTEYSLTHVIMIKCLKICENQCKVLHILKGGYQEKRCWEGEIQC